MSEGRAFEEIRKELCSVLVEVGRKDLFHEVDRFFSDIFILAALVGEAGGEASVLRENYDAVVERRGGLRLHHSGWKEDAKECTTRLTDREDNTISFEVGV